MLVKTRSVQRLPKQASALFEAEIPFLAGPIPLPLQLLINLLLFLFRLFLPAG
jgi:hypothetical protein